jgi:cytochrome P450
MLLRHPRVLNKLTEEIRSNFDSDEDLNFEALVKLPYLTAVIEEGLRIFPSAPIGFVRKVPQGGDTVDGEFIPEGVSVYLTKRTIQELRFANIVSNAVRLDHCFCVYVGCNP